MNKQNTVKLKNVNKTDLEFLYDLLKERDPNANISHKKMPSLKEHEEFVCSKPYSKWYIIMLKEEKIGSIYLSKQDEIGIFLKKNVQRKQLGGLALNLMMEKNPRKRFLANVNPKNKNSVRFFKQNGFKLIQHTYELEQENS